MAPVSAFANEIEGTETFQPLDLFDMAWITNPEISPDGESVVYVRRGYDINKDSGRSSLWTIAVDGSGHEPLTGSGHSVSSPVWSPGGDRLAYVSNSAGTSQIHVRWMQTGRDIAITQLLESPQSLTWSPDGTRLAFVQFVPAAHAPIAQMPSKPEGADWAAEAKVYEDSFYRSDSQGFLKPGKNHIFIVSAEGGKPVQLTWEDFPHNGGLSFSPDGSQLYFSSNYADDWQIDGTESNIFVVDIASREVSQVTDRDGPDFAPQVSPDGKWLVYRGSDDTPEYQDIKLYITSRAEYAPRQLVELDRPVTGARWATDSKSVFFSYVDQAVAKVAKTDLRGNFETVAENLGGTSLGRPYVAGSFSVARNETIAHDVTSIHQPANLAVTRKGKTRTLTSLNKDLLTYHTMGDVEEIWFESSKDGLPV
ncbi:MAG: LpqB family beta-propeller domain-containing protein, partial [Pseudomonadales bacterium]